MADATLRVVIADDEPLARERVRHLLATIPSVEVVAEASGGLEAVDIVERLQPDVLLLDIQMPDLDGMRVLEALDDPPAVIFSTAFEHHAVRAFECEAVDYLLKPYSAQRLSRAIGRARRLLDAVGAAPVEPPGPPVRIAAENGLATELVPTERVVALRIDSRVVFLLRDDGERLTCADTLQELETRLPAAQFFRASRQAIINLTHVRSWEPDDEGGLLLRLSAGFEERVSRRRAGHFRARTR